MVSQDVLDEMDMMAVMAAMVPRETRVLLARMYVPSLPLLCSFASTST